MLALLRILFGFALFSVFAKAIRLAGDNPNTEGTTDGGYVALAVGIGILNAIVWAPFIGRLMADPLTGAFTSGNPADFTNRGLQFAHKLAVRGWRRWALFFAFLEGVRHPDLPGAFVLGLNHARPGSWLEKVFAREVWRFQNAENCLRAWKILQARGVTLDLHPRAEVNLLIQSQQRIAPPPATVLEVPPAPEIPLPKRNEQIRIFAPAAATSTSASSGGLSAGTEASPASATPPASEAASASAPATLTLRPHGSRSTPGNPPAPPESLPAAESISISDPPVPAPPLSWRERLRVLFTGRSTP
ncbi:MAG: hypothetical protein IT580_20035 [Verrucomicrobiales bacterium]|nr:hypothetical protein [Verrucomicrobiales bacterium]